MILGPKPMPHDAGKESPYQYHIDFLHNITKLAESKNMRELEHPSIVGTLIFIRTTIREKELGSAEFAPHYKATKQAILENLGIDYLRSWIANIEATEARYTKKKPDPIDSSAQRKLTPEEIKALLLKYFNDLWKQLTATIFDDIEKLTLSDLNEDEFCANVYRAEPFNWGKHRDENDSIDLNNAIKKGLCNRWGISEREFVTSLSLCNRYRNDARLRLLQKYPPPASLPFFGFRRTL